MESGGDDPNVAEDGNAWITTMSFEGREMEPILNKTEAAGTMFCPDAEETSLGRIAGTDEPQVRHKKLRLAEVTNVEESQTQTLALERGSLVSR